MSQCLHKLQAYVPTHNLDHLDFGKTELTIVANQYPGLYCILWTCYYYYSKSWKVNRSEQSDDSQQNKLLVGFIIWQLSASALLITKTAKMLWRLFFEIYEEKDFLKKFWNC